MNKTTWYCLRATSTLSNGQFTGQTFMFSSLHNASIPDEVQANLRDIALRALTTLLELNTSFFSNEDGIMLKRHKELIRNAQRRDISF
ncbi:MAG: hypothetical protein ACOCXT_06485 [Candidatus Dojkabacteria bacterium]